MRDAPRPEEDQVWGGRRWQFQSDAQRVWLERMVAKGWTVPTWAKEYGGAGLSVEEAAVLKEELAAIRARIPLENFGIRMLGPALLKFGSESLKREHLPPIARGEIRWCQGYSEPNAGSDLASLQMKCEDNGDHWLVNGQKIWTTYAHHADKIFCLVRTDPSAKTKQLGISFLLIDMAWPGVTPKPITLISGRSHFCETFFDNVKVPKDQLVGQINRGWEVAKYLLTHERDTSPGPRAVAALPPLGVVAMQSGAGENGRIADPMLRSELARLDVDGWAFGLTMERIMDETRAGQGTGALSSIIKYAGAELNKRRTEMAMTVLGSDALEWESERSEDGKAAREWLRTKAGSIAGGTSEINLNIIAKRILGLPDA
jgi:alkylation response protein AidB-like acyl-CoA dehydrogenase